jgi:hypothetical protein
MGLFGKWLGSRWSLYVVRNGNQIAYAMHENSAIRIAGYVMGYFAGGAKPVGPWSLYLNFNRMHKTILLRPEHFTAGGENVTKQLIAEIDEIDPGWKVKGGEPVFEEAATKRRLKISEHSSGHIDIQVMLKQINEPPEVTFNSVMDEVFGKS